MAKIMWILLCLDKIGHVETDAKKSHWPRNMPKIKIYNFYPVKLIFRQFNLLMSWLVISPINKNSLKNVDFLNESLYLWSSNFFASVSIVSQACISSYFAKEKLEKEVLESWRTSRISYSRSAFKRRLFFFKTPLH